MLHLDSKAKLEMNSKKNKKNSKRKQIGCIHVSSTLPNSYVCFYKIWASQIHYCRWFWMVTHSPIFLILKAHELSLLISTDHHTRILWGPGNTSNFTLQYIFFHEFLDTSLNLENDLFTRILNEILFSSQSIFCVSMNFCIS